jgi:hypothetical protein
MAQYNQHPRQGVVNWVALALFVGAVFALIFVTSGGRSSSKEDAAPAGASLSSLAEKTLSPPSPKVGALTAPLPSNPLAEIDGLQLTLLHTNDTWGYLGPCG